VRRIFEQKGIPAAYTKGKFTPPPPPPPKIPKLDHRYFTVKNLRGKEEVAKELNKEAMAGLVKKDGFLVPEDERILVNNNSFRLDKGRNVSCSFDGGKNRCVTCPGGSHPAFTSKDDLPLCFALADQHFSPNLPAKDGKECIRIMRVENGYLRELVGEFISLVARRKIIPGSVILLGSITHLERDGTAQYAEDWHSCRRWLRNDLGDVTVLPLIPMPMEEVAEKETIRSLLEFFNWFGSLPDSEVKLLEETRANFLKMYVERIGTGGGWCDERQSGWMPVSLSNCNKERVVSRLWGNRPLTIAAFSEQTEQYWVTRIVENINSDFSLDLSTDLCFSRQLSERRRVETALCRTRAVVAGGSNAGKLFASMSRLGQKAISLAKPGWRLTMERVDELKVKLSTLCTEEVCVLYGLDNACFLSVGEDMHSGPPFIGRDGAYHAHGRLEVLSGYHLDRLLENLEGVMLAWTGKLLLIVLPIPRYWIPCCKVKSTGNTEEAKLSLLNDLGNFRRKVAGIIARLKVGDSVKLVDPLEVLRLGKSIPDIEQVMADSYHLLPACYDMLAEKVDSLSVGWSAGKRRAELELGPAGKRFKFDQRKWVAGPARTGNNSGY